MKEKYNEKTLRSIVYISESISEVCRKLGLKNSGGSANTIKKYITKYDIDTSHFTGKAWNKGDILTSKWPIEEFTSNRRVIQTFKLRNRLLKDGIFERKCSSCGGVEWLGKPIPIELDHINGNKHDNSIENLRLLCPNCHAQTPTYKSKNRKSYREKHNLCAPNPR